MRQAGRKAPGRNDTPLNENHVAAIPCPADIRARTGEVHPAGRSGAPEEAAALIRRPAGPDAGLVAEKVRTVDGGRVAKPSAP